MTQPEEGPLLSPGFWLQQAALTWRAELDTRLRPLGMTPTQFILLASAGWLEHLGHAPTQQDIAKHASADRMMTSKVIRALEQRHFLARRAHESDGRALRITLTPAGRDVLRHATRLAREVDTVLFGGKPSSLGAELRQIAGRRTTEDEEPPPPLRSSSSLTA